MAGRRDLTFASLDDVMPEVERLLAGHTTVGRWTLGQICNHLAAALRLTLEAPPSSAEPTREQRVARRLFFRSGRFPDGMEAPVRVLQPQPGLDAATESEALREAIGRFSRGLRAVPGPSGPRAADQRRVDPVPQPALCPSSRLRRAGRGTHPSS